MYISADRSSFFRGDRDRSDGTGDSGECFEIGADRLKAKAARGRSSFGAETRGVATRDDQESVILVDAGNNLIGSCGKLAAHREGKLHRAFSILITNQEGELLLQRRAAGKYHFANRWSNACCGHPRPGELTSAAAGRRLMEELSFRVTLTQVRELCYRASDTISGLVEHEYLHVFHGVYSGDPSPDPDEVGAWRWVAPDQVRRELASCPGWFTPWFAFLAAMHAGD